MNTISDFQPTDVSPPIDSSFRFGCQGYRFFIFFMEKLKSQTSGGQLAQNTKIAHHLDEQRAWRGRGLVGNLIILDLTTVNASQFPQPTCTF